MADFSNLIAKIKAAIYANGQQLITGEVLQDALVSTVNAVNGAKLDEGDESLVGTKTDGGGELFNSASEASASNSHAEGSSTHATGAASHAEGATTAASGAGSHAEGQRTTASGAASHAEGYSSIASGNYSHAEGYSSTASGNRSHAEGARALASGGTSHAEGYETEASGDYSHAEGYQSVSSGSASHAEGMGQASGDYSHAEGGGTTPTEGYPLVPTASGKYAHAEGTHSTASGGASHAEGSKSIASGVQAHAEGSTTIASAGQAHAEGYDTEASGVAAHAEGNATVASGNSAHAEGYDTEASGASAHAEGQHTTAANTGEHASGMYNISRAGDTDADTTLFSVGAGQDGSPLNALEVRRNGDVYIKGIGGFTGEAPLTGEETTLPAALDSLSATAGANTAAVEVLGTYKGWSYLQGQLLSDKWHEENPTGGTLNLGAASWPEDITSIDLRGWDFTGVNSFRLDVWNAAGTGREYLKRIVFDEANLSAVTSLAYGFYDGQNLKEIVGFTGFTGLTGEGLTYIFHKCLSLEEIDVSGLCSANITSLRNTFYNCASLKSIDLSTWDISGVTNMQQTFSHCYSLESINMTGWANSIVTTLHSFATNCQNLKNLDLSFLKVNQVTAMVNLCRSCVSLETLNLTGWVISDDCVLTDALAGVPATCVITCSQDTKDKFLAAGTGTQITTWNIVE